MPINRKIQEEVRKAQTLASIRADVEKAAKELNAKTEAVGVLASHMGELEKKIAAHTFTISQLEDSIARNQSLLAELDSRIAAKKDEENESAKQLDATKKALGDTHAELIKAESALANTEQLIMERNHDASLLEEEIISLKAANAELTDSLASLRKTSDDEIRALNTQRAEVQELLAKNEKVSTSITNDLALLESYVKRLQRFYDQNNINLDVLTEFGIPKRTHHE